MWGEKGPLYEPEVSLLASALFDYESSFPNKIICFAVASVRPANDSLTKQDYVKADIRREQRVPPNQILTPHFLEMRPVLEITLSSRSQSDTLLIYVSEILFTKFPVSRAAFYFFFSLFTGTEKCPCVQVIWRRNCLRPLPEFLYFSTSKPAHDSPSLDLHEQWRPLSCLTSAWSTERLVFSFCRCNKTMQQWSSIT